MSGVTGAWRAPYACDPAAAGGRLMEEPPSADRTPYQRDRDRILHATAFRRLALKTQVFMPGEGDHHRTRLTHSLEVAQVARSMARSLGLDEDLTEALALAHDLGHGPFGHTGESALDAVMAPYGGFDHNVQSLRVVVDLEQRYLDFDGLNLTRDTLEGLAKRNGPTDAPSALLRDYDARIGLRLGEQPGAEAQVAAVADDIAYNAHDLEDGLRAGLIALDDVVAVEPIGDLVRAIERGRAAVDVTRMPAALARGMINVFVEDALRETRRRLDAAAPANVAAVRGLADPVASLSRDALVAAGAVKAFLFGRLYRHPRLVATRAQAHAIVGDLARCFLDHPERLPTPWALRGAPSACGMAGRARLVSDYIAGMTDRHALREHRRLFDATPDFV
jgi:dGTPase